MKRILLLVATNFAVLLLLGIVLSILQSVFGVRLGNNGTLLVFAAVFGFGGAFVSLAISKWMAKRSTGAQVILVAPFDVGAVVRVSIDPSLR